MRRPAVGSGSHLSTELFAAMADIQARPHPLSRGTGPMQGDLWAAIVDMSITTFPSVFGQLRGGGLRPIRRDGRRARLILPDLPTVAERACPGYVGVIHYGMVRRRNEPRHRRAPQRRAAQRAPAREDVRARILEEGGEPRLADMSDASDLDREPRPRYRNSSVGKTKDATGGDDPHAASDDALLSRHFGFGCRLAFAVQAGQFSGETGSPPSSRMRARTSSRPSALRSSALRALGRWARLFPPAPPCRSGITPRSRHARLRDGRRSEGSRRARRPHGDRTQAAAPQLPEHGGKSG